MYAGHKAQKIFCKRCNSIDHIQLTIIKAAAFTPGPLVHLKMCIPIFILLQQNISVSKEHFPFPEENWKQGRNDPGSWSCKAWQVVGQKDRWSIQYNTIQYKAIYRWSIQYNAIYRWSIRYNTTYRWSIIGKLKAWLGGQNKIFTLNAQTLTNLYFWVLKHHPDVEIEKNFYENLTKTIGKNYPNSCPQKT